MKSCSFFLGLMLVCASQVALADESPVVVSSQESALAVPAAAFAPSPAEVAVEAPAPVVAYQSEVQRGIASWYGPRFHGRRTASGEVYDMHALTAAHPFLPFGTLLRVRNLISGKIVDVRVNDRGPHVARRVIELSKAAAAVRGLHEPGGGTPPVALSILEAVGLEGRASVSKRLARSASRGTSPAHR